MCSKLDELDQEEKMLFIHIGLGWVGFIENEKSLPRIIPANRPFPSPVAERILHTRRKWHPLPQKQAAPHMRPRGVPYTNAGEALQREQKGEGQSSRKVPKVPLQEGQKQHEQGKGRRCNAFHRCFRRIHQGQTEERGNVEREEGTQGEGRKRQANSGKERRGREEAIHNFIPRSMNFP